ncbi:MAG: SDR family NAD(P)-dependent oxidoreductase [Campylobacterales bacterium]|nr:SDR family NAD(P)-dependent oxidoreductase [Campylobacterales bacterium]
MKTAFISGASSGIGLECAKYFLNKNYKVVAVARDFSKCDIHHEHFLKIECDLSDVKNFDEILKDVSKSYHVDVLINNAGFGIFKPLEEINSIDITNMINTNLTSHILATKYFLPNLKKHHGYIFNINSIEAVRFSKFSALYSATKAGLRAFGLSLFEEVRKSGVRVVNINPDITKTEFFKNLNFTHEDDIGSFIDVNSIIKIIDLSLNLDDESIMTDVTIRPKKVAIKKKGAS